MSHHINVCEFGQVHGQCRCPSPAKLVKKVKCNTPKKHEAIMAAVQTAEIDHETKVETLLYSLETLPAKFDMGVDAQIELQNLVKNLRQVLDVDGPN